MSEPRFAGLALRNSSAFPGTVVIAVLVVTVNTVAGLGPRQVDGRRTRSQQRRRTS